MPLNLDPAFRFELEEALRRKDYGKAQQLLINEIERNPAAPKYELLTYLGGVFFVDKKYLNAAVAFKKAEALTPLDSGNRFTLAMSYVLLEHRDWARPELEQLARTEPNNPLYRYWLARLDFDDSDYVAAIRNLERTLQIDSRFVRAHDRLGLCYQALERTPEAVESFSKAVALNRKADAPSPWPPLNLGTLLIQIGDYGQAEENLREAVEIDPGFSQAHYQLGLALEKQTSFEQAAVSLKKAAELDPAHPETYWALARVLRRMGDRPGAEEAIEQYQKLRKQQRQESSPDF